MDNNDTDKLLESIKIELTQFLNISHPTATTNLASTADVQPRPTIQKTTLEASAAKYDNQVMVPNDEDGVDRLLNQSLNNARNPDKGSEQENFGVKPIRTYVPEEPHSLDANLMRMQRNLEQSYKLFNNISERLSSIDFTNLKTRIRDLHLSGGNTEVGKSTAAELKKKFDQCFEENRLHELTDEMRAGFSKHPGEFGDIPELSEFFKTFNQLQRGLADFDQTRRESADMKNRLMLATESSLSRVHEIKEILKKDKEKEDSMEEQEENE